MGDKYEIIYNAVDSLAQAILNNRIPLKPKEYDPLTDFIEECSWPDTYLRYKEKVKNMEKEFGYDPLRDHQWWTIETYLFAQYGLEL